MHSTHMHRQYRTHHWHAHTQTHSQTRARVQCEAGPLTVVACPAWRGVAREQDWLHHVARIEVPIKTIQGYMYVRISAPMYNVREDYEQLADAVARLLGLS